MEYIDNKIEEEKVKIRDDFSFQNPLSKHRATNEFYESVQTYRSTLQKLCTDPIQKDSSVDSKQLENVQKITEWGGRIIASYAVSSAGMPALIPLASSLGSEAGKLSPTIAQVILTAKDELLNKHQATRGNEELQKLILLPLEILTPKFIDSLIKRSRKNFIIIIFESHERTRVADNSIKLDDWFSKLFLSPRSKFIEEKNNHRVRFVISARKNLTSRPDWSQLKEYNKDKFFSIHLDYFSKSEVKAFLKNRLGRIYKDLSDDEEDRFFKITHGHPKYLELICKQRENIEGKRQDSEDFDYSEINLEIAQEFLVDLSNSQKRVIQRVSCCRWLDRKLTEDYTHSLKDILPDEDVSGFKWFDWLIQRHFVKLTNDKYHFDDLSRQVFRRSLFQEDRDSFYRVHQELADYFKRKANQLLPEKPVFSKYDDPDWCEYIGEYLYHACFAQSKDFQSEYIYHLFASSYLNKNSIIKHSFHAVIDESDLDHHPLIHSSTRAFLKSLSFISTYSWVAFELDSNTDCGKYQSKIEAATLLCKSHLESLEEGIGKVAVLEYIIKNLTPNISDDERELYRSKLLEEIERTANPIDPDFSSKLFMQSVCWQIDVDSSLKWCEKAINYKPDNPNAWYRKGLIIERQVNENLAQKTEQYLVVDRLNESLACYERALDIQPYDHRFWLARGNILMQLGDGFRCRIHQMLDEPDLTPKGKTTMPDSGDASILQKAAYYQRALESYREAYRFRPNDRSLKKAIDGAVEKRDNELDKLNQFTLKAEHKSSNNSVETNDLEEYSQLIQRGDEIRLNGHSVNESQSTTENRLRTALDLYCKAIFQKPEYPLGWYSRGLAHAELGKLKKSQEYLRKAISDYSKSLDIKSDLDWAFYDRGIAYYQLARISC